IRDDLVTGVQTCALPIYVYRCARAAGRVAGPIRQLAQGPAGAIRAIVRRDALQNCLFRRRTVNSPPQIDQLPGRPGERFDPYVRLVRCLMPRTSCVAMFGPAGELAWSSESMLGPDLDLTSLVDEALLAGRSNPDSAGQVRVLPGSVPVYLCLLR